MENRRVLVIMPHPDDIELLCAGTLLRLRQQGCAIHLVTMTAGDKGSVELARAADRVRASGGGAARCGHAGRGLVHLPGLCRPGNRVRQPFSPSRRGIAA